MRSRGALIVIEGIDRSGKSTQCLKLEQSLKNAGHQVKALKFPGISIWYASVLPLNFWLTGECSNFLKPIISNAVKLRLCALNFIPIQNWNRTTEIGKMINSYLQNTKEIDDHAVHLLFSANRWEQSSDMVASLKNGVTLVVDRYAYSGAAFTSAKKNFTLDWCKQSDSGLPEPDLVLFLDLSVMDAEKRGGFGEERYEKKDFQESVHKNFMKLKSRQWQVIDANESFEDVHRKLLSASENVISNVGHSPIGTLWKKE